MRLGLFKCDANYMLTPSNATMNTCLDGKWSVPTIPTCTRVRCTKPLPPLANGGTMGSCNPGLAGESCTFKYVHENGLKIDQLSFKMLPWLCADRSVKCAVRQQRTVGSLRSDTCLYSGKLHGHERRSSHVSLRVGEMSSARCTHERDAANVHVQRRIVVCDEL